MNTSFNINELSLHNIAIVYGDGKIRLFSYATVKYTQVYAPTYSIGNNVSVVDKTDIKDGDVDDKKMIQFIIKLFYC